MSLIYYQMGEQVEAFTAGRDTELPYHVIQPHQIHGDRVAVVDRPNMTRDDLEGVDAIITHLTDCAIGVRTADCVPILLYDPINKVAAAVHSGWRGTVLKIARKVIDKMCILYGTRPNDLFAVIGPSISVDSFSVHDDVRNAFEDAFPPINEICRSKGNGIYQIDLWQANIWLLKMSGVNPANIKIAGVCTFKKHNDFYSARYEHNNKCGRNINAIRIKESCEE